MEPMNLTLSKAPLEILTDVELGPQGIEERMISLFITAGVNYGKNIQALECELDGLASKNRILVAEITQLTSVHAAELNATVDGYLATKNLIIEKLKTIIERLNAFPEGYKCCGYTPLNPMPFQEIVNELGSKNLEPHYAQLRKYPEYYDMRSDKEPPQVAIIPVSNIPLTMLAQPITMKLTEEIASLEAKVAPLRAENHALIEKKEIMIDFHRRHFEELNRTEKLGRFKEIIEQVRTIYNNIKWEVPRSDGTQCSDCSKLFDPTLWTPISRRYSIIYHHEGKQQVVQDKVKDVREHVLAAVVSLEGLL